MIIRGININSWFLVFIWTDDTEIQVFVYASVSMHVFNSLLCPSESLEPVTSGSEPVKCPGLGL